MKRKTIAMTAVLALGAMAISSSGAVVVGSEDFESYLTGNWNAITAPNANPATWYNGDNASAISISIVDEIATSQELQLDVNLQDSWQVGVTYELSCSNNASIYIDDYSMDFYLRIPPASLTNLTNASSLVMSIRDPNDTSRGSAYNVASYDPGYTNTQSGGVITIPLDTGGLASGSTMPMDGSVTNWQIEFRIDSNKSTNSLPITIAIDDMVVTYTEPPFLNTTWSPVGLTTNDPVVSATVYDGTKEVDSLMLYLDGGLVASNTYAGGSISNTISYNWIGAPGGIHTGAVVAVAADSFAETNSWTFTIPLPPPAPATNILQLFSFNLEGSNPGDPYLNPVPNDKHSVSNGTLGAAPSLGSNIWNNLMFVNAWYIWDPWNHTLAEASGGSNACIFSIQLGDNGAVGTYINSPWNWNGELNNFVASTATAQTMWPVWLGETVTDLDLYLDGLDSSATYDLYMYYTSPNSLNTNTTTYTVEEGSAPSPAATLISSWDPLTGIGGSPTNYVEGVNYAVITKVSPTAGGRITVNVSGSNKAGIAAMQVAMRNDGGPIGPTVDPDIQSMTMAGGMVTLMFDSESGFIYTVNSKSNLTDTSWTAVTNVTGAGATTSAEVPASSDAEFFMIEGN